MAQLLREHNVFAEVYSLLNNANTKQFLTTCKLQFRWSDDLLRHWQIPTFLYTYPHTGTQRCIQLKIKQI